MVDRQPGGAARIGILLPPECDLGWRLRASALAAEVARAGYRAEVGITGIPPEAPMPPALTEPFRDLKGVGLRRLAWQTVPAEIVRRIHGEALVPSGVPEVALPFDWGWHFLDCDAWLLCGDGALGLVPTLRPMAVYCRGLPMRQAPELFAASAEDPNWTRLEQAFFGWRQAATVLAADPLVVTDLADYAGVPRRRIVEMTPLLVPRPMQSTAAGQVLLWWLGPGERPEVQALAALPWLMDEIPTLRLLVTGPGAGTAELPGFGGRLRCMPAETEAGMMRLAAKASTLWFSGSTAPEAEPAWLAACGPGRLVARDLPELRAASVRFGLASHPYAADDPLALAATLADAVRAGRVPMTRYEASPQPALAKLLRELVAHDVG
jgi:hypothetical protein